MNNKNIKPFYIFAKGDFFHLLNIRDLKFGRIEAEEAHKFWSGEVLSQETLKKFSLYSVQNVVKSFNEGESNEAVLREVFAKPPALYSVSLFVTQDCNMACRYCYGDEGNFNGSGNMKEEVAIEAIEAFFAGKSPKESMVINFFGGEPLINFTLIKKIVEYVKAKYKDFSVHFSLNTNGVLLNDEILDFFIKEGVCFNISFDGGEKIQNFNRPLKNADNSYTTVLPKIQKALSQKAGIACRATLYGDEKAKNIWQELRNAGFKKIAIEAASECMLNQGQKDTVLTNISGLKEWFGDSCEQFICGVKKKNTKMVENALSNASFADGLQYLYRANLPGNNLRRMFFCGAGKAMVAIAANGKVYPCQRFVGMDEFVIGESLASLKPKRELFWQSLLIYGEKCKSCFARYFCGGGCMYDNLVKNKNMLLPDEQFCDVMCFKAEYIIYVLSCLKGEDLGWLRQKKFSIFPECVFDLFG